MREPVDSIRDSLPMAALLAAVGGFLDSFTYFGHGRVFANAMSGNVVLLGAYAAAGNWPQSFRHLIPIAAFLLGVATAQLLCLPGVRRFVTDPSLAAVAAEIAFLVAAGWYPAASPDFPLVLGISFLAAMQSSSFTRVHQWSYSSTMTTGNLRHFGETAFRALFQPQDPEAMHQTRVFGAICLTFLAGATAGGLGVTRIHNRALWVPSVPLFIAGLLLLVERRHAVAGHHLTSMPNKSAHMS
jgi:uncharacterized membrane protein YoaK (UPF0700 family)